MTKRGTRRTIMLALAAGGAALPALAAGPAPQLGPVSITLPADEALLPDGPGADIANGNCLACHSGEMITVQPHLSAEQWKATVEKMRAAYKAPVQDEDVPGIVDYLVRINGAKAPGPADVKAQQPNPPMRSDGH